MVTRVPIYLGGTGESTQAAAQAALGLHTSNSVAFANVFSNSVNLLANDGVTLATARGNDHSTLLTAYSNDVTTLATARGNDHSTLLTAYSNDVTTLATARGNDHATLLSAYSNDVTTLATARANDHATYYAVLTSPLLYRVDTSTEGGEISFARAVDNVSAWGIDVFGTLANTSLRFIDTAKSTERMRIDSNGLVGIGTSSPDYLLTLQTGDAAISMKDTGGTTRAYIGIAGIDGVSPTGALRLRSDQGGIVFSYLGFETMRIDSSRNVGIGTNSPTATLDVSGTFSDAKANTVQQTLTDAATIAWNTSLGRIATVTLGASRTFGAPTNIKVGTYILHVIQGGTGSYTITWNGVFKWTAATAPTLSTAVGRRDVFSFISDGTNLYGAMIPDVR